MARTYKAARRRRWSEFHRWINEKWHPTTGKAVAVLALKLLQEIQARFKRLDQ